MSEVLAQLEKKGGGKPKETTLWTNTSTSTQFSSQDVSLSSSIENFDYIKIIWGQMSASQSLKSVIIESEIMREMGASNGNPKIAIGSYDSGVGGTVARMLTTKNTTTVNFGSAFRYGSQTAYDTYVIPRKIIGLKL